MFNSRRPARSYQQALGTAEAGTIDQQSYVAGEPEPTRVGESLSIEQKRIRLAPKFLQDREDCRGFAKREQTRHVRKANGAADYVLLNDDLILDIPHDDAGHTPT